MIILELSSIPITNDTKVILERLIATKKEMDGLLKSNDRYSIIKIILLSSFVVYALTFLYLHPEENILFMVADFLANGLHLGYLAIIIFISLKKSSVQAQIEKLKGNLERLRLESIDHLRNTWFINAHSEIRDKISTCMEENHDINVRYKSS